MGEASRSVLDGRTSRSSLLRRTAKKAGTKTAFVMSAANRSCRMPEYSGGVGIMAELIIDGVVVNATPEDYAMRKPKPKPKATKAEDKPFAVMRLRRVI